jgi:N-acetylglucosamine kinase-like BadF-type ATPase
VRREPLIELPPALTQPKTGGDVRYVLGVDGGATKTLAAVMDLHEEKVHLGHGGSSNPDAVGAELARSALRKATGDALGGAGVGAGDLGGAVLAMAGTDTDAIRALLAPAEQGAPSPAAESWVIVNDVVGAWAAATGAAPGVGVISGTGSNVLGVGPRSRTWRAGGWGHVLGDEGSGYWLAVHSIRAALRERDGSGPPTALSEAAIRFFGVESIEALAALVYAKPLAKGELAGFAAETGRIAGEGDAVARSLYERAARELGEQVKAAIRETGLEGEFPVGLIGGGFKAGAVFVAPLRAAIAEVAPEARVAPVEMPPVGGCILLAARAAGHPHGLDVPALKRLLELALRAES